MAEITSAVGDFIEDFPPSYSEATTTPSPSSLPSLSSIRQPGQYGSIPQASSLTAIFPSPISSHLSTLPAQMRAAQEAHANEQAARDLDTIDRLVPAIESFLADLVGNPSNPSSSSRGIPPLAELTLVPASAVPHGWALTGAAERRREGEVVRVMRVEDLTSSMYHTKAESKSSRPGVGEKGSTQRPTTHNDSDDDGAQFSDSRAAGFDEWGRFTDDIGEAATDPGKGTFFRDERAARRLAAYLQPRPVVKTERREIQQAVVDAKKASGWRWGRKKSETSSVAAPAPAPVPIPTSTVGPVKGQDDRISVSVRADEVTFRRENDWGVWESLTGYGIVVTVRVRKT